MKLRFFLPIILLSLGVTLSYAQPANNNCAGGVTLSDCPGAASTPGTTVASTNSFAYPPWGGACMGSSTGDVWYQHLSGPGDNTLNFTVTAGTLGGNVQVMLIIANCASQNCTCPFLIVNDWCAAGSVSVTNYTIQPNTLYYFVVSGSGAQGTFNICAQSFSAPPQPGQDCITAENICNYSSPIVVPLIDLGNGTVDENTGTGWSTCIGSEQSSQWYQFTCSQSGTYSLMLTPANWTAPQSGDDFDFEFYEITSSGCTSSATSLACDYSPCRGSTGFSATGGAGFSQVGGTNYQNNDPIGPANCSGGPQWNSTSVSLTAGSTYALMVQNFTGSLGGVSITFGGTAVIGPQAGFSISVSGCTVTITNNFPNIPNYNYSWAFGDGASSTSSAATIVHTYASAGTYTIAMGVSDAIGCAVTANQVVNCTPLPIELLSLTGNYNEGLRVNQIDWVTATETNNEYFTLEYSSNAVDWKLVGVIPGANNSNSAVAYQQLHDSPFNVTYYRLKQTDYDGRSKTFPPIVVKRNAEAGNDFAFSLFPNPTDGFMTVETNYDRAYWIEISDNTGKVIYSILSPAKKYTLDLNHLDKGIYFVGTYMDGVKKTLKFIRN